MNNQDRKLFSDVNEKLGRIDERTNNIYRLTEKQESHLEKLNASVAENSKGVAVNKTRIKMILWILGASGLLGGGTAGIIKLLQ